MAVQVVLMEDVKDLGLQGDVVMVSEGYARNCLFPRDLAAKLTPETQKRLEKIRRERDAARKIEIEAANVLSAKLSETSCTIPVKVSEAEKLFGSVTDADIAKALSVQGFAIEKSQVLLEKPIKELGVYDIPIRIHAEVNGTIKVWVVEE